MTSLQTFEVRPTERDPGPAAVRCRPGIGARDADGSVNVTADAACDVWWADPAGVRERHLRLLSPQERQRRDSLRQPADRDRFTAARALLRLAVAEATGVDACDVPVEASCPDCDRAHGKPSVPGWGLEVSLSHSRHRVVVAVTTAGPVGVDVEWVDQDVQVGGIALHVLSADERRAWCDAGGRPRARDFYEYWVRKESVVKATGDGLRIPLTAVEVSEPLLPPRVLAYAGMDVSRFAMSEFDVGEGYVAALTVLASYGVGVRARVRDGGSLLAAPVSSLLSL